MARLIGALTLAAFTAVACTDAMPVDPLPVAHVSLQLWNFPAVDTVAEGSYQAWFVDADGRLYPSDRFASPGVEGFEVVLASPIAEPSHVMISFEPAGDTLAAPSTLKIIGGEFFGGVAELGTNGYITPNIPLEESPGVHVLGTFVALGTPTLPGNQDAGLWIMDPAGDTLDGTYYQDFTPVTEGWMYEGWVVRDYASPDEVWLSYGKFRPDGFRQARFRDDTGLGPFSGKVDYERALPVAVRIPGDDWIANPLDLPVPGGLTLPIDLNGDPEHDVASRWTHVITIEPYEERWEDPWTSTPWFIRPYRDDIGEAAPSVLRTIEYHGESLPRGTARVVGR